MKLEVGMFVRFKTLSNEVKIGQIQLIDNSIYELDNNEVTADKYIIKASHNIIDLIEVGDYVNGYEVYKIFLTDAVLVKNKDYPLICRSEIKSIVTKEQFEQIQYKVGE